MNHQIIDKETNDIQYGSKNIPRFSEPEHAGVCSAGPLLIGALIVCYNTRESLGTSSDVAGGEAKIPIPNWQIDEAQEKQVQAWAESKGVWIPNSDKLLTASFGPMIAQGAEAKVFYKEGSGAVVKARTSIYATLGRAIEAIALHNYLFPETSMKVFGFTRDTDGLFRILLSQPYIDVSVWQRKQKLMLW